MIQIFKFKMGHLHENYLPYNKVRFFTKWFPLFDVGGRGLHLYHCDLWILIFSGFFSHGICVDKTCPGPEVKRFHGWFTPPVDWARWGKTGQSCRVVWKVSLPKDFCQISSLAQIFTWWIMGFVEWVSWVFGAATWVEIVLCFGVKFMSNTTASCVWRCCFP